MSISDFGPLPMPDTQRPRQGFLQTLHMSGETICAGETCSHEITPGTVIFLDTWTDPPAVFCEICGPCVRYSRRKAIERGDYERKDIRT